MRRWCRSPRGFLAPLLLLLALVGSPGWAHGQSGVDKATAKVDKAAADAEKVAASADKNAGRLKGVLGKVRAAKAKLTGDTTPPGAARPVPSPGGSATAAEPTGSAASAHRQPGSAKIDVQVVAPNEQGLAYSITPKGVHLATLLPKGSRWAVAFDGVVGPTFDQIMSHPGGGRLAFSPDGSRFAYGARSGSDYVVMVDGKEVRRAPIKNNPQLAGGAGLWLQFTPNSKHFHFYYTNLAARDSREDPNVYFWDGVAGPPGAEQGIVVSPDGERHAYTVRNPANPEQMALAVDGKLVPGIGLHPVFTNDGKHLFTMRGSPPVQGRPVTELLLDGRPIARAESIELHVPPVGDRVVLVIGRGTPRGGANSYSLAVGGQRIAGSEASRYVRVVFSPDGKRFAAIAEVAGSRQRVVVDGRPGPDYDTIDSVWFSPDSKRAVYTGRSSTQTFVVIDTVESEVGFAVIPPISVKFTRGGRIGWLATTQQGDAAVIDGKVTRMPPRVPAGAFSFSPDGSRFAYFLGAEASGTFGGNVVVDHAPGPPSRLQEFAQLRAGDPIKFIWSPDGKYTVHYASPGTGAHTGEFGFVIGGKFLSSGKTARVVFPTFTPDAKHLFWMVEDGANQVMKVVLDGRAIYEFDMLGIEPMKVPGGWEMGEAGTLTFIHQSAEGFKRVRVTPGSENGFEAWLATGKPLR